MPPEAGQRRMRARGLIWMGTFAVALFLFLLAIRLMETGGAGLRSHLAVVDWNAIATLGIGALLAYLFLSGKPVAAFALTLFATGGLTRLQAFTTLSGGRLGAAFVVLLVGFLYASRDRQAGRDPLGVGVLTLVVTTVVYVPGMFLGYGLLKSGALDGLRLTNVHVANGVGTLTKWIVTPAHDALPDALLLPIGGLVIVLAIKLLDRLLPQIDAYRRVRSNGRGGGRGRWSMFGLGFGATLVTFSVSVALTALVPLAARRLITREQALPYILGSNVATLVDTLLVAVLVGNAVGVQIVLAEAIGVAVVTAILVLALYRPLEGAVLAIDEWVVSDRRHLWLFVLSIFVLPVLLIALGFVIGRQP
jgi:Na+/phosphate symporter